MKVRKEAGPLRRPRGDAALRPRNIDATKRRLVDAVGAILARDGFMRLGVNAVAAEARTDKALIYRYFGGLPELLVAYAESASFWPSVEEMAGGPIERLAEMPLRERWTQAISCYLEEIRKRHTTQEILAWEIVERNELTAKLEEVRERRGLQLMKALAHDAPPGVDVPAVSALFAGSVHYLVLRARQIRVFNGIDLRTGEGWERVRKAATSMVLGILEAETK
jgi:AcrR family transcriptional regulator